MTLEQDDLPRGHSGLIDLQPKRARDYKQFYLRKNPFPPIGVPTSDELITVDREQVIRRFQNVISEVVSTGDSIITVLVGPYGSGKSHLLRVFKNSVNRQLLTSEEPMIAVYVKSPGEDFRDFFLGFVEDIGRTALTGYSEKAIRAFVDENKDAVSRIIHDGVVQTTISHSDYDVGDVLRNSQFHNLFEQIRQSRFSDVHSHDLVIAFLTLAHPDYSSRAWRWLIGESLDRIEKESIQVEQTIDDANTAYSVFTDVIRLFRNIGISSFLILLDELEKLTILQASREARYEDMLRRMLDDHTKSIGFYFAIAPKQWEEITTRGTALVRRLAGNWYLLGKFEADFTKELLERYLAAARLEEYNTKVARSRFPDCEPSLAPFASDAVASIQRISKGLISNIILVNRTLLEYLYDSQGQYQSINAKMVDEVKDREHWKFD